MAATPDDRLDLAQRNKLTAIIDRLDIGEGKSALEIGCGWGALLRS